MPELSLSLSRDIKAPIKAVFSAWLNPITLARFMIPGEGVTVPSVENDPQVGGQFTIVMKVGDQELPHSGEYRVIDPFSQIVFTWESARSIDGSLVSLNFSEIDGGTRIELTQVKFFDEEARNDHNNGWSRILQTLDQALTATTP